MRQPGKKVGRYIGFIIGCIALMLTGISHGQPVEIAKLASTDGDPDQRENQSVAIDGNYMVVGARLNDDNGDDSGSAYVYKWDGTQWNLDVRLVPSDGAAGDEFGQAVAMDGNRIVVGSPNDDGIDNDIGSAYVYRLDSGQWIEEAKLTASNGIWLDHFGYAVSISGDRIVIGVKDDGDNGTSSGAVYVYHWNGSQWIQETKLTASDGESGDRLGWSVSIDGDCIVAGAFYDDDNGYNSGSAYVYRWNGSQWIQETKILPTTIQVDDHFGSSVAVKGNRIVIGNPRDDDLGTDSGSAYVLRWNGNQWVQEAILLAGDGAADSYFGSSVAIDGDNIIVGASRDDYPSFLISGAVYVFHWDGSQWIEEAKLNASDVGSYRWVGRSVAIDGDNIVTNSRLFAYVFHEYQPVPVWLPDTTATYNEALTVPIYVDDTTGSGIVSAEAFLAYDGDLLTAISSGTSGTLLTDNWSVETHIVEGIGTSIDTIKMAMATDDDVLGGDGTLINVNFQMADIRHPAFSPLTLTHVLFNDGTPGHAKTDGSVTLVGTDGVLTSLPSEILPRWSVGVSVYDTDEDRNTGVRNAFDIGVINDSQTETLTVTETGSSTGVYSGVIGTEFSLSPISDDGIIQAKAGDQIVFSYADSLDAAGNTQMRTDATDVLGGTDGLIRATVVSQPGDTVRVRVSDADLSDAVAVSVGNPRTGEIESILLSQFASGESHFYGRFFTDPQAGAVGDSTLEVTKGDVLSITYADTLTAAGGTAAVVDDDEVVNPFGDAHPNGSVQAFDAAQVLIHRLSTYGGGTGTLSELDSLSANVDQGAPFGIIDGYDASLILRKVVGLISRFEVQEPDAVNHPQPETQLRPKPVPEERVLALVPGEGYVSVWMEDRGEIVSGELTLVGVQGQVVMGEELQAFLTASQATEDGLQVVFAGSEAVSGPGELLRVAGVGPGDARLTRVSFNGGRISARWEEETVSARVPLAFALYPNVPNPFNPETVIRFALARESQVWLEVFDVVGQRVRTLVAEPLPGGAHQVVWDGRSESGELVSSGVYFCRLKARHEGGAFSQVRRMLLLK